MTRAALARFAAALTSVIFVAGILAWTPAAADEEADRKAAVAAATQEGTQWLDALDAHRYADSWTEAAAVMKEGRTQDDWVRDVGTPREVFGKAVMREIKHAEYSTSVRGAPEGKYVTAAYLTQFSNAPPAIETVLMVLEEGHWRIGGYSVERAAEPETPPSGKDQAGASPKPKAKE
jgi:hypothetical protein